MSGTAILELKACLHETRHSGRLVVVGHFNLRTRTCACELDTRALEAILRFAPKRWRRTITYQLPVGRWKIDEASLSSVHTALSKEYITLTALP